MTEAQIIRVQGNLKLNIRGQIEEEPKIQSDTIDFGIINGDNVIIFYPLSEMQSEMKQVNKGNSQGFQTIISGSKTVFVGEVVDSSLNTSVIFPETPEATLSIPYNWNGEVWLDNPSAKFGATLTKVTTKYNPHL
jgi:hypothetical protein